MKEYLIIGFTRRLEVVLYVLDWIFTICVSILSVGCISTYLYQTVYRQGWGTFMVLLIRSIIVWLVLIAIEHILIQSVEMENRTVIFPYKRAKKWKSRLALECNVFFYVWFVVTIIGRIKVGGHVQHFTGDPWWAVVHNTSFRTLILFLLCKNMQIRFVSKNILNEEC